MNEHDMPNFPRRADLHSHHRGDSVSRPSTPAAPPTAPASHSSAPDAQPSSPSPRPAASAARPTAPRRSVSAAQPKAPTPQHGASVFKPVAPTSQPVAKASQPAEPVARPQESLIPGLEETGIRSRRIEQERQRARRRVRARRIRSFFILTLVIAFLGGASYLAWTALGDSPSILAKDDYSGTGETPVQITIYEGALGTDIGNVLLEHDVVKSMDAFLRAFESNKAASSIRPGTYSLKTKMSASEAIAALLDEKNRTENTVTVIPGQTLKQVTEKMTEVTGFAPEDIQAALADSAAIGLPAEANGNVEGWLAPGSYELSTDETPVTLLKEMIAARVAQFEALKIPEGERQNLLIKASILDREVNIDEYLPKVARVIENRLADPNGETVGRLQMDSTVLYGVGKTGGIPTAEDLASDTPYNTYKIKGLPAGPISNPDEKALAAMASPAEGTWLYFVTINLDTAETRFASTVQEHDANKQLLDEYCAAHPKQCYK